MCCFTTCEGFRKHNSGQTHWSVLLYKLLVSSYLVRVYGFCGSVCPFPLRVNLLLAKLSDAAVLSRSIPRSVYNKARHTDVLFRSSAPDGARLTCSPTSRTACGCFAGFLERAHTHISASLNSKTVSKLHERDRLENGDRSKRKQHRATL